MSFGGWSIHKDTFDYILDFLPPGKTILELGSGFGTGELAKYYKMYSIESNTQWVGKYNSTYIHAPIKMYDKEYTVPAIPGNTGWYNPNSLESILPNIKYDLIFVDGPQGKFGRGGFYKHLDMFDTNLPIVFDDITREPELILMQMVAERLGKNYEIISQYAGIIK